MLQFLFTSSENQNYMIGIISHISQGYYLSKISFLYPNVALYMFSLWSQKEEAEGFVLHMRLILRPFCNSTTETNDITNTSPLVGCWNQ